MLTFQNGGFTACGFAFTVPDGFRINTEPDIGLPDGFGTWSPDGNCYVEWEIEDGCNGTYEELKELFVLGPHSLPLLDISPVIVNGLPGHHVAYSCKRGQCYELRLSAGSSAELSFRVESNTADILTAIRTPAIRDAINRIHPTENPILPR